MPFKEGITLYGSMINIDGGNDILTYSMEYAEDSTKENPKMLVNGKQIISKKEYSEVIDLNSIDMSNATLFEMEALRAHLAKQDKNFDKLNVITPTSRGQYYKFGEKYNFLSDFQRDISVYKNGGFFDSYLMSSRALDKFLDFFDKRKV